MTPAFGLSVSSRRVGPPVPIMALPDPRIPAHEILSESVLATPAIENRPESV
jgi:hypothetical protein